MKQIKPKNKIEELLMSFMGEEGMIDRDEDMKDLENKMGKVVRWEEFYGWLKVELDK